MPSTPMTNSPRTVLVDLLVSLFQGAEPLRQFTVHNPNLDKRIRSVVDWTGSMVTVVESFVDNLDRRGLLKEEFFNSLCADFPHRKPVIDTVAGQWLSVRGTDSMLSENAVGSATARPLPRLAGLGSIKLADGVELSFYGTCDDFGVPLEADSDPDSDSESGSDARAALFDRGQELLDWALARGDENIALLAVRVSDRSEPVIFAASMGVGGVVCLLRRAGEPLFLSEELLRKALLDSVAGATSVRLMATDLAELDASIAKCASAVKQDLEKRRRKQLAELHGRFVDPDVRDGDGKSLPALSVLDEWRVNSTRLALVLGEFGRGKSTLLTVWAENAWRAMDGPLPVLVPLSEARAEDEPRALLLHALALRDTPQERARLALLIRHRRLIPTFDGLDEVATKINREALATRLGAMSQCAGLQGKALISARDHLFGSDSDLEHVLPGARRIVIEALTDRHLKGLFDDLAESGVVDAGFRTRITAIHDLGDLIRRPLLLTMIVATGDRFGPGAGIADVYEAYVDRWLENARVGAPEALSDDEKRAFAEALAVALWTRGDPSCTTDELRRHILHIFGERLLDEAIDNASLFYELQGSAFISREGRRFRFAHRSFHEFFLAKALVKQLASAPARVLDTRPLTDEVIDFVGELLEGRRAVRRSAPIEAVQRWLRDHRFGGAAPPDYQVPDPRENALRLLLGLARREKGNAQWVEEGADLRYIRIRHLDLRNAQLANVRLDHATLSGANMGGANLRGASMHCTVLRGVCLERTDLREVNARAADLTGAEADRADLRGADLSGANLDMSVWTDCSWEGVTVGELASNRAVIQGFSPETPGRQWFDLADARLVTCDTEQFPLATVAVDSTDTFAVLQRYPLIECRYVCAETGAPLYAHMMDASLR